MGSKLTNPVISRLHPVDDEAISIPYRHLQYAVLCISKAGTMEAPTSAGKFITGDNLAIALALVGAGAAAMSAAAPLFAPDLPSIVWKTLFTFGAFLAAWGFSLLGAKFIPSRIFRALIVLAISIAAGAWSFEYNNSIKHTCAQPVDSVSLSRYLIEKRELKRSSVPLVVIYTEEDVNICPFAKSLEDSFVLASWPVSVKMEPLKGPGIIFHAKYDDKDALSVYLQLWHYAPLQFDAAFEKDRTWVFWIKDSLPKTVQALR